MPHSWAIMLACLIPVLSSFLATCAPAGPVASGYVEGEYLLIAPVVTGQIDSIAVARGDRVAAKQAIGEMEARDAAIALAQAKAAVAKAENELANKRQGHRPEEIAVIEAALVSARAQAAETARSLIRVESLFLRGTITEAQRDDVATAKEVADARVHEVEANLAVARLPARPQEIAVSEAALGVALADRDKAEWALDKRHLTAPASGLITDILRNAGEIAGPSQPVLVLLPEGGVKLRLYVAEPVLASLAAGTRLSVHCDGCAAGLGAVVTYISDQPEFTPPVIYSRENRQKLVYLVEARPEGDSPLKPGQIVDVTLAADTP